MSYHYLLFEYLDILIYNLKLSPKYSGYFYVRWILFIFDVKNIC